MKTVEKPSVAISWKFQLPYLRNDSASTKYALEALTLLFQINALLSPKDAYGLVWNRFACNMSGYGNNIPLDLNMEFLNRLLKEVVRKLGPNAKNPKTIDRYCRAVNVTKVVLSNFDREISLVKRSGNHIRASALPDLHKVIVELVSQKAFTWTPNRKYIHYMNFQSSLLEGMDTPISKKVVIVKGDSASSCGISKEYPNQVTFVALEACDREIQGHLQSCKIRDSEIDNEMKLLLSRAAALKEYLATTFPEEIEVKDSKQFELGYYGLPGNRRFNITNELHLAKAYSLEKKGWVSLWLQKTVTSNKRCCEHGSGASTATPTKRARQIGDDEDDSNVTSSLDARIDSLREKHPDMPEFKLQVWAKMLVNNDHQSEDEPPQFSFFKGKSSKTKASSTSINDRNGPREDNKFKRDVDVQATIEEPQFYILGNSRSTVEDQMKFVPTRQEDLRQLSTKITTELGVQIDDKMRFMNGDNPAIQMEDGTQHGGNYACVGCDGNIQSSYDLEYILQRKYLSLQEKRDHILKGTEGRKQSLHPYKDLKKAEIVRDLRARRCNINGEEKKEALQQKLTEILGGTTRLPALLHRDIRGGSAFNTNELNLNNYEVLFFEALHATMNHIKNVLTELPHHITDIDTLITLKELLSIQLSKDKLRGVDYRKTLIFVAIGLYPSATFEIRSLLITLCEMIEICYSQDEDRSPKMILRLYNLCWRHAILCRRILTPPKSLTYRKLFGIYFHSFTSHAPFLLRQVSHRSTNAEMFERLFEKISNITDKTWSRRIEDLTSNAVLHIQVENANRNSEPFIIKEEREISKMAKSLPKLENTLLSKEFIEKYAGDWEMHLRNIADFLVPAEGVWWKDHGEHIEFFDGPEEPAFRPQGPKLHHYRSTSILDEKAFLSDCWSYCTDNEISIPATKIKINGKWQRSAICCQFQSATNLPDNSSNTEVQMIVEQQQEDNNEEETDDFILVEDFNAEIEIEELHPEQNENNSLPADQEQPQVGSKRPCQHIQNSEPVCKKTKTDSDIDNEEGHNEQDKITDQYQPQLTESLPEKEHAHVVSKQQPPQNAEPVCKQRKTDSAVRLALKSANLPDAKWEMVLPDALHSVRSLLSTATNATPHERFFGFQRRSTHGTSLPTWLQSPGPVLLHRYVRTSKNDPLVDQVELKEANPTYAHIKYLDDRKSTVSLRDLAPCPQVSIKITTPSGTVPPTLDAAEPAQLRADPQPAEKERLKN
ncbi:hypothetical protein AC249_AIPGENE11011 [Exaiptasia diaphana]|nr:hypothetical protein AC249_AIPGENE11011 [Exaiptasia diaphana]